MSDSQTDHETWRKESPNKSQVHWILKVLYQNNWIETANLFDKY